MNANCIIAMMVASAVSSAPAADYPPVPEYAGDTSDWGEHIQRTMGLLEDSTSEHPNTVRILFYGQSIMGGQWHEIVETWLEEKYPHANVEIENRALGGFSSAYLYRTAHHDLFPFYPDLVIFHVYGDHHRYEQIIHDIRQRTTAEVMILTDHWKRNDLRDGELKFGDWDQFFDELVLPRVAEKYQAELVDVRWPWKAYLEEHDLEPGDLLKDNVHLNEHGKWLMAQLAMRQMHLRPERMTERSKSMVRDLRIAEQVKFEDGKLSLTFTGNRVALISESAGTGAVRVRVDGKAPSELPESYYFTRPSTVIPPESWPSLYRIEHETPLVEEHWTLELLELDETLENFKFRVTGSVTGPDGEGLSSERFVSDSGRVVIEPDAWVLPRALKLKGVSAEPGMKIHWQAKAHGQDVFVQSPALGKRTVTPIFQGGLSQTHELELFADGVIEQISAVRIYSPPIEPGEFQHMGLKPGDTAELDEGSISEPTPE